MHITKNRKSVKKNKGICKNSKQKLKAKFERRKSYSPPHKKLSRRKSAWTKAKINRIKSMSKSTTNLCTNNNKKRKIITKNKKQKIKRYSKSVGKSYGCTTRKPKSKRLKERKPTLRFIYTANHHEAAIIIQRWWRTFIAQNQILEDKFIHKSNSNSSPVDATKSRRKLRHSFSFGIEAKSSEAYEKFVIDSKSKLIPEHQYRNEIMMIENFNIDVNMQLGKMNYSAEVESLDMHTDGKTDIASIVNENLEKCFNSASNSIEGEYVDSSIDNNTSQDNYISHRITRAKRKNIIVNHKHIKNQRSLLRNFGPTNDRNYSQNPSRNNSCLISPKNKRQCKSVLLRNSISDSKENTQTEWSNDEILIDFKESGAKSKNYDHERSLLLHEIEIHHEEVDKVLENLEPIIKSGGAHKRNSQSLCNQHKNISNNCDFNFINSIKADFDIAK